MQWELATAHTGAAATHAKWFVRILYRQWRNQVELCSLTGCTLSLSASDSLILATLLLNGAITFCRCFSFFLTVPWRPIISECTRPIFTKFSRLVVLWVKMSDLTFALQSLKGRCYGNHFCPTPPLFIILMILAFENLDKRRWCLNCVLLEEIC